MPTTPSPLANFAAFLVGACLCLGGCQSADSKARHAYNDYQTAIAANDMPGARKALLTLVSVQDNVPENWVELGKVQASTGAYGDALFAFTRAYELNRRDPEILRSVIELNMRTGDLTTAQQRVRELEVIAPGDSWIKLADGYVALKQLRFDEAQAAADAMLATSPSDSNSKVLKARALMGLSRPDEALALLTAQIAAQPNDVGSLLLAEKIYEQRSDWPRVAEIARRLIELTPDNREMAFQLISASLRSGKPTVARQASLRLLQPATDPAIITSVLDIWAEYWPSPQRMSDARALGSAALRLDQKLAYAAFLNRVGDPAGAMALIGSATTLPVTADNVQANAVRAEALSRGGKNGQAAALFDAVLSYDSGNPTALRGRAAQRLRTGQAKDALPDVQKLVSVLPKSAADRILLARCYTAVGDQALAERTLWDGFHDIPGNDILFLALKQGKRGNVDAIASLTEEYSQQRNAELYRGLL